MFSVANPYNRKLVFEGNSLLNAGAIVATQTTNDFYKQYIPLSVYDSVKVGRTLSYFCYAIEARTGAQILTQQRGLPILQQNDVLVYWEGTNDLGINGLTGAQAFANFTSYLTNALQKTSKILACTVIARDYTTDPVDLITRINDYNVLMRANTGLGYTLCDLGADSRFDDRTDCSDTTYYATDKIHLVTAGQDAIATLINTGVTSLL